MSSSRGVPATETWPMATGGDGQYIDKLQGEVARIYADPAMQERLQKAGLFPVSSTPAEFDTFIRDEIVQWSKVIKDNAGIRLE